MEQLTALVKNTLLPAFIFGFALLSFYARGEISGYSMLTLHYAFYVLSFSAFLILIYFNRRKPVFMILSILLGYILINYAKRTYGADYTVSPAFNNLCFFIPFNLALFYFLPAGRLLARRNIYFLLLVLFQFTIGEKLSQNNIVLGYSFSELEVSNLNSLSIFLFFCATAAAFIYSSVNGQIGSTANFFVIFEVFLGFYYSASTTALTIFFSAAALTIVVALIQEIYYSTYKDVLTGLASRNSYIVDAKNFPLKYSTGIICIDDYERLGKVFGRLRLGALTRMIANRISETETEGMIYRYAPDEFVVIFKNEDKNTGYERLEKIRRAIASAEFILNPRRKPIKLTVSCSISEKKRSDANSFEVLLRAHKALEKTHKFSQNVTSKA